MPSKLYEDMNTLYAELNEPLPPPTPVNASPLFRPVPSDKLQTKMGTKVQVQIRYCFCCSLWVSTLLIALYTILVYLLLLGLASWAFSDVEGSDAHYIDCYQKANESFSCRDHYEVGTIGQTRVVTCDASSYHCSLGLYTGELKYDRIPRQPLLILNMFIYAVLVLCAILLIIALCTGIEWLLVPWMGFIVLDIIRGIISVILIFVLSLGNLTRIAVGIFFLGVQMSLLLIVIAKFQEERARKKPVTIEKPVEAMILADGSNIYPTMPSQHGYGTARRQGYYQPSQYNTYAGREGSAYRYPDNVSYTARSDNPYGTMYR